MSTNPDRRMLILLVLTSLAGGAVALVDAGGAAPATAAEKHLFVWTGDQARKAPDFLAVVDFDETSRSYGKILTTVPLPAPGASNNEPHHVGLSGDGKVLACGGLLSRTPGPEGDLLLRRVQPGGAEVPVGGRSPAVGDHRRVLRAARRRLPS